MVWPRTWKRQTILENEHESCMCKTELQCLLHSPLQLQVPLQLGEVMVDDSTTMVDAL